MHFETPNQKKLRTIWASLGNTPTEAEVRLQEILVDFYETQARDVLIGFFFTGRDLVTIATHQKSFLMKAMGVTPTFQGKVPAKAHTDLPPILSGHFDRRLVLLAEVLKRHGMADKDIRIWVGFEASFREVIVSQPPA
ncbi:MAG: hypothetical protein JNL01_13410 [Bdellovibrionales bacterium]|nr:hypothetical protein [Bdellovibrionales bacterium]